MVSKGALKIRNKMGTIRRNERKIRWQFQLVRRECWTVETGENINFVKNCFTKNENQVFKRARFCQENAAKRRHTYYTTKGQNAYDVRNKVLIRYRVWWKEKRKRLFIRVARACHRGKAICCGRKMGNNKDKKRRKKSVGAKRRRKCSRRKMKCCEI